MTPSTPRGPLRTASYLVVAVALGLAALEGLARAAESQGLGGVTLDDRANYVLGPIYEPDGDGLRTSEYAGRWMIPSRIPLHPTPDHPRVFVLGGSFAMGTPYEYQGYGREVGGGLVSWLRAFDSERRLELINASAGGQSSFRVRRIVQRLLANEPDLLVVASCNNEGVAPPSRLQEWAHRSAVFRVLRDLLQEEASPSERPLFARRDRSNQEIAADFEANLRAIAADTERAGVPLLLAAPPANLRREEARELEPAPPPGGVCEEAARGLEADEADALPQRCDASPGALMALGERLLGEGASGPARVAFEAAMELGVDGRCPASMRRVIREVAGDFAHAEYVDLQRAAVAASADAVPGVDLFIDHCHMNWRGERAMGHALAEILDARGWLSALPQDRVRAPVVPGPMPQVFVANRRWPPDGTPPDEALERPIRFGMAGEGSAEAFGPPSTRIGPWALIPLLLDAEHGQGRDPLASYTMTQRDGGLELYGYVSGDDAALVQRAGGGLVTVALWPTPQGPQDRPMALPVERIAGPELGAPLTPEGPVRLRVR